MRVEAVVEQAVDLGHREHGQAVARRAADVRLVAAGVERVRHPTLRGDGCRLGVAASQRAALASMHDRHAAADCARADAERTAAQLGRRR